MIEDGNSQIVFLKEYIHAYILVTSLSGFPVFRTLFLFSKQNIVMHLTWAKPLLSLGFLFSDFDLLFSRLKPCYISVRGDLSQE